MKQTIKTVIDPVEFMRVLKVTIQSIAINIINDPNENIIVNGVGLSNNTLENGKDITISMRPIIRQNKNFPQVSTLFNLDLMNAASSS
ncbi:hypothetical protein pb186bvf_001104 [Paramecium bursaria]